MTQFTSADDMVHALLRNLKMPPLIHPHHAESSSLQCRAVQIGIPLENVLEDSNVPLDATRVFNEIVTLLNRAVEHRNKLSKFVNMFCCDVVLYYYEDKPLVRLFYTLVSENPLKYVAGSSAHRCSCCDAPFIRHQLSGKLMCNQLQCDACELIPFMTRVYTYGNSKMHAVHYEWVHKCGKPEIVSNFPEHQRLDPRICALCKASLHLRQRKHCYFCSLDSNVTTHPQCCFHLIEQTYMILDKLNFLPPVLSSIVVLDYLRHNAEDTSKFDSSYLFKRK